MNALQDCEDQLRDGTGHAGATGSTGRTGVTPATGRTGVTDRTGLDGPRVAPSSHATTLPRMSRMLP